MSEQLTNGAGGESPNVVTEEYLMGLHKVLGEEKGSRIYHRDCPTPEHLAGYYIDAYGGLDKAISGVRVALSGEFIDQVPFSGDDQVLTILETAKANQAEVTE